MAEGTNESMPGETKEEEPFNTIPVKRKRKIEKMEDMETSNRSKRPSFPPAKPEKLMVFNYVSFDHKLLSKRCRW